MRSYTRLQVRLAKLPGIADYTFAVESEDAGEMKDWVVAGIDFANCEEQAILMSVYIYKFSVGFQRIDLECQVSEASKQIMLRLVQKPAAGALSFEENAGDVFLSDLANGLKNEFHGKKYEKGTRDIFQLVKRLNWGPEVKHLEQQQRSLKPVWKYILAGAVVVGAWALWKSTRK